MIGATAGRIIFVNRFYAPDLSATSQLLTELASELARRGFSIVIITGRAAYGGGKTSLPPRETIDGVIVHRVMSTSFGRHRMLGRVLDYLGFHCSATYRLLLTVAKGDIVVAKTDPPLISVPAWMVCWLRSAILVNWLQDVFPEVLAATLLNRSNSPQPPRWLRWFTRLRDGSLKFARSNVVIGERMGQRIVASGVAGSRVRVIDNWANGRLVHPVAHEENELRKKWNLNNRFVVGYSGNLGIAHEFETILEAATRLRSHSDIVFLFIGAGVRSGQLMKLVKARSLSNVQFQPYQDRSCLAESLSVPDVHLVCLRTELEGLIVPSKFYGVLAAGRPCIFIGDGQGELAAKVTDGNCGRVVRMGDAEQLAAVILGLTQDPQQVRAMGLAARRLLEGRFDFPIAVEKWTTLIGELRSPEGVMGKAA